MKFAAFPSLLAAVLCALSAGCTDPNIFDENAAKVSAESEPFQLDSEQVSMRDTQLSCGANNDLWDAPSGVGGGGVSAFGPSSERYVARLQQKGRDLNFTDDITSGDSGYSSPYTQVRGKFQLQLDHVASIKDGDDKNTKIVQAKVGVKIANPCFDSPLPIMGVRKGKYSDDLPVTLQYEYDGFSWHLTKIIH